MEVAMEVALEVATAVALEGDMVWVVMVVMVWAVLEATEWGELVEWDKTYSPDVKSFVNICTSNFYLEVIFSIGFLGCCNISRIT